MPTSTSSWSAEQLTAFLASIAHNTDEATVARVAVEHAAEALDCEIAALVRADGVVTSVGFATGETPERELVDAAMNESRHMLLAGGRSVELVSASLEESEPGKLLVARLGGDPFRPEEVIVLRGMARILGMTTISMRTVNSLQERQRLLERSAAIQQAITLRAPLQGVLELICEAAGDLIGDELVWLRSGSNDDPSVQRTIARHAQGGLSATASDYGSLGEDVAARAIRRDRLVTVARKPHEKVRDSLTLRAAMAAPIHDRGAATGSLVVASPSRTRPYSASEQEMLVMFAQHASLAFLDARTVEELLRQALHDPLTSLANRALFLDRLDHALARAEREHSTVAVLFIDLDRFKSVNDSRGHSVGDALLLQVGERLQTLTRSSDTVARLGGDEFAVLVEDVADQAAVAHLAEQIVITLRRPFTIDGDEVRLSASVGIALASERADDPIREADHAMYRAKNGGRDRYEFFQQGMRATMIERLELEVDLEHAIERGELALFYQPIAELSSGRVIGAEALIRWHHPVRGLLEPAAFIPIAEETGSICEIGYWVLREACERASSWGTERAHAERPFVSVNLAPIQLQQHELVEKIAQTLEQTGLDPARLVLEITETSLLKDTGVIGRLRALKRLGLRVAVDDFGTGYSSLHYLQLFPLDALKIPKVFIDRLGRGSEGSALAQATIGLGRTFRLDVIAEGIESPDQLTRLRRLGCTAGQGFALSRPVIAQRIDTMLADPSFSLLYAAPSSAFSMAGIATIAEAAGAMVSLAPTARLRIHR